MNDRFVLMLKLILVLAAQLPQFNTCQVCGVAVIQRRVCEKCYWDEALL